MTMSKEKAPKPRKRKRTSKLPPQEIDTRAVVENEFQRRINVRLNGKRTIMSGFEAIYRQLLKREVSGDPHALKVRLQYEKFAESRREPTERKIVVIGGLPRGDDI